MRKRGSILADLASDELESANPVGEEQARLARELNRSRRPHAISMSVPALKGIQEAVSDQVEAEELKKAMAEGHTIVELDPGLVDPSPVQDRMAYSSKDQADLVQSIKSDGQQVPILVRPLGGGRYQVAFGHRRLRAVKELGLKVRAVVRELSDEELFVAQGQENNVRSGLTWIERARFAAALVARKIPLDRIEQALGVGKAERSRMKSVTDAIPLDIIEAIGPAPDVGRRRWLELAQQMADPSVHDRVRQAVAAITLENTVPDKNKDPDDGDLDLAEMISVRRFTTAMKALANDSEAAGKPETGKAQAWAPTNGSPIAKFKDADTRFSLLIDQKAAPEFGKFLMQRLDALYTEFLASKSA